MEEIFELCFQVSGVHVHTSVGEDAGLANRLASAEAQKALCV